MHRANAKDIEAIIITSSLLATESISEKWAEVTSEDPMPTKSNWIVRTEMVFVFLHMMYRYAFEAGGPEFRDILQDSVSENAIREIVTLSFPETRNVEGNSDIEQWLYNIIDECITDLNQTDRDYTNCERLFSKRKRAGTPFDEETILGKLAGMICNETDQAVNVPLRLLIWTSAFEALAKSGLKEQVQKVCEESR